MGWLIVTTGGKFCCKRISYPRMQEDIWDRLGESVERYEEITCLEHAWRLARAGNVIMLGSPDTKIGVAIFPEHICAISLTNDEDEGDEEEDA